MEQLTDVFRVLQVLLGIGLVIFVHEAGHFIAARLCRVRVDVFSIGFGPALFRWKRGDTTYQLSALPLGGYVRMAGEDAYLEPDRKAQAGELGSKTVGQRFFIYSGGVLMNLAFGFVVFPVLFLVGVPFTPVTGARFLVAAGEDRGKWIARFGEALRSVCDQGEVSGVHINFCLPDEIEAVSGRVDGEDERGYMLRVGFQYHWINRSYGCFDDYLAQFRSKRRNQVRRERRAMQEQPRQPGLQSRKPYRPL